MRGDLRELSCYEPHGRMNTWLFFFYKLTGIAHRGVLEELELYGFDKT